MSEVNLKTRLLMSSVIAGAMFVATAVAPAVAQEEEEVATTAPAAEDAESRQERVTVTGSRIQQLNLTTTSPVSSVTSQDIKLQGVTRVEDLVVQLPQAFASQNSTVANGASGTATVSLRNLGSTRTLVLIDGKRMPYGSPNDPAADLNLIPGQLVERVDVLTGGASAVYGSDAVSGVVNFIMKKDFEGVQVDAQYGFLSHENDYDTNGNLRDVIAGRAATNPAQFKLPEDNVTLGYSKEITGIVGVRTDDGRGGLQGYVSYRNNDAVLQAFYDYSACSIGSATSTGFTCGGSGTASPARFTDFATFNLTIDRNTGALRNFSNATDQYNFGPLNYYQRPDERYSAGFMADYEINPNVEAYANFMFMDYSSVAQIAPSGNFFSTSTINCDNPLLPSAMRPQIGCTPARIAAGDSVDFYIGRRNTEGGGRQDNLGYQTYRGVIGLRGPLFNAPAFEYDVSAQFSQVTLARAYQNDFSISRLTRAVDVITNPSTGQPACRSTVDGSDPNCVPYNPFVAGGITPAALDYLQVPLLQNGTTEQNVVIASITGDLGQYGFKLPSADTGLQVAAGLEYRRDAINQIVDNSFRTGDGAGQGGPTLPLSGEVDVYDLFAEFQLPLVTGAPGIELLSLDGAARVSDYSTGISSDAWKVGAEYAPTQDLRLRASYQQAVRAPNVIDLFTSQGLGLFDLDDDPCDFTDPAGDGSASAAACIGGARHQLTTVQANGGFVTSPAGQYNQLTGGNPALNPEEATTFTVGFVATPSFLPGLNLSVDYYDIEISEAISSVGSSVTTDLCYFQADADACGRITRNPGNGAIWTGAGLVQDLNLNIGGIKTSGIDVAGNYGFEVGPLGAIALSYNGTYLNSFEVDPINQAFAKYDCVGAYGNSCGTPTPEYRHRARLGWETPWEGLGLNATWRHIGEVALDSGVTTRVDSVLEAQDYFDFAGTWAVKDWAAFRFGVNNALDNDPPLSASVGTTGNGNTFPQTYDALGRYVFVGLTLDF